MTGFKTVGKGSYQQLVIDRLGIENEVVTMLKDGFSYSQIATVLKSKGHSISVNSIGKWVRSKRKSVMTKESKNIEKFESICINYQEEITDILAEVKQVKDKARDDGKLDTYVKLIGKLYQGLELLAKLMGDIRPNGSVDINLIINEINQNAFEQHKDNRHNLFNNKIFDVEAEIISTGENDE